MQIQSHFSEHHVFRNKDISCNVILVYSVMLYPFTHSRKVYLESGKIKIDTAYTQSVC